MKKIFNISLLALSMIVISACDSGFDELNTSKTAATSPGSWVDFKQCNYKFLAGRFTINFELAIVQQLTIAQHGRVGRR